MSLHINAERGEVAERVLIPGDPLRAKYIAENFLEDAVCYNEVRGMYGFTGTYKGKRVSVQGTGMGMPSAAIYINELIDSFGAKKLIRVGSCGSIQKNVKIRDIIIPMTASTNSNMNRRYFGNLDFAPCADFELLNAAYGQKNTIDSKVHVGGIITNDTFHGGDEEEIKKLIEHGVLALEMETSALYTIAAGKKVQALTILTVSDSMVTSEEVSPEERQTTFNDMVRMALEII